MYTFIYKLSCDTFDVLVSLVFYIGTSYLMMYILALRTFNLVVMGLA